MNLTCSDLLAIGPLLILFVTALLVLFLETFVKNAWVGLVTVAGLVLAFCVALGAPSSTNPLLTPWLKFDSLTTFFTELFLLIGIAVVAISSSFFKRYQVGKAEFYFLLLSCVFGLILIAQSADFLTLFLGLETLSIGLYVLCSYMKTWAVSHEASFKYFLLGSISTSFLLFGIALVYGATGTTRFDALTPTNDTLFLSGIALISVSLLFKAAAVPFHIWAPDVYAGAPTPVTAFMAVGTKAGAFAAFIRIFLTSLPTIDPLWHQMIAFFAYATLIYANFVAMKQVELRRFFAYSGISHAGFLLIPVIAKTPDSIPSMYFYLVVYALATLGSFACFSFIDNKEEGVTLRDLRGLFSSSPLLAGVFSLCLLTLAGIPPTVGFFAKFYILKVAFSAGYIGLVIVGLLTTILAAYYYLRIVAAIFSEKEGRASVAIKSTPTALAAGVCMAALIALSFYPEPLFKLFVAH